MPIDRISGLEDVDGVLDLGIVPIGGIYWPEVSGTVISAPLRLGRSRGSGLVQLMDRYDSSLYESYTFSGHSSASYTKHVLGVAGRFLATQPVTGSIFEVGASDGVFLAHAATRGWTATGVEPSHELAAAGREAGIDIRQGFVTARWAEKHTKRYDAIVMRHVLEHLDDPTDMFLALDYLAHKGTTLLVELPSLEAILGNHHFSNIFHEHVAYYSQAVLWGLLARFGWGVVHYETVDIHGGSHLLHCRRSSHEVKPAPDVSLDDLRRFTTACQTYTAMAEKILLPHIEGKRWGIYGASHRTSGLLSLAGAIQLRATSAFDSNQLLWGRFLPPHGTSIHSPSDISRDNLDTIVICATAYQDEIALSLHPFISAGGVVVGLRGEKPTLITKGPECR